MDILSRPRKNFLFLQGNASPFFGALGQALVERGHAVRRINFNAGDLAFWPLPHAVNYSGDLGGWAPVLVSYISRWNITDIVLLGDCRPLHRKAIKVAAAANIAVYVFEEGYLRPNWITLEKGGVNAWSTLGRSPGWFLAEARKTAPWSEPSVAKNSMFRRALDDIAYVSMTAAGAFFFRGYQSHRPWSSWVEYTGGARRFLRRPAAKRALSHLLDEMERDGLPYYLFPLQLEADSQIRYHSKYGGLRLAIEHVVRSFATSAPREAMLIITEHPLDTSPFDWRRTVVELSAEYGVEHRVKFFEGGSPERTIQGCRGVITVNSTLGYLALSLGKPLIALGAAIYGIEGLTFQGDLDRFWLEAQAPDPIVFDAFRRVVATRTQVNGSFYGREGVKLAVAGSLARLEAIDEKLPGRLPATAPDPIQRAARVEVNASSVTPGYSSVS
jgi:capsular polysaccharide export protein